MRSWSSKNVLCTELLQLIHPLPLPPPPSLSLSLTLALLTLTETSCEMNPPPPSHPPRDLSLEYSPSPNLTRPYYTANLPHPDPPRLLQLTEFMQFFQGFTKLKFTMKAPSLSQSLSQSLSLNLPFQHILFSSDQLRQFT